MVQAPPSSEPVTESLLKSVAELVEATERLVRSIGIPAGARVLDIGTGTGHAALAAARRRAIVTGIDINNEVLDLARARADAEGLTDIEFRHADALQMPFENGSFDYVLSTLGLVFVPDQEAAARELARVVRPGGTIALTAHTTNGVASQIYELVNGLAKDPNKPARPHYTWSLGPRAGELLTPYFREVRVRYDSFETCFPSPQACMDSVTRSNPNIRRVMERLPAEDVKTLREGYLRIINSFNRATDGTYMANMDFAVITGVRGG